MTDLLEQAMPNGKPFGFAVAYGGKPSCSAASPRSSVYAKLKNLSASQQDAMATMILEDLEDETALLLKLFLVLQMY